MIHFRCPHFAQPFAAKGSAAGQVLLCPKCSGEMPIPAAPVEGDSLATVSSWRPPAKAPAPVGIFASLGRALAGIVSGEPIEIAGTRDRITVQVGRDETDPPFRVESNHRLAEFLLFYLGTPIGPRVILEKCQGEFSRDFTGWMLTVHGERGPDGRLLESMNCLGFNANGWECGRPTKNPNGFCAKHDKPGTRTRWTHSPELDAPA